MPPTFYYTCNKERVVTNSVFECFCDELIELKVDGLDGLGAGLDGILRLERLSSHMALSEIRKAGYNHRRSKGLVDSYAAREILQTFLNGLAVNDKED